MLLIKLQGGLGNQMFQYAAAKGVSKTNQHIHLDHLFLEKNNIDTGHFTARDYQLQIFKNLKANKATPHQLNLFKSLSLYYKFLRLLFKTTVIKQTGNEYISLAEPAKSTNLYLDGYFQSEKYFKHKRQQLMEEFEFPSLDTGNEQLKNKIINAPNSVSIHIRRGDYLKSPIIYDIHGVVPLNYYYKALNILESSHPNLSLFIFSDDSNWAQANLNVPDVDTYFVTGNQLRNSWKDMALMRCCKHHIIANSSFSWWGAWLSQNNGDVFAPSNWFNAANVRFNINDFIPDNWHIIQND
jgi:hypothetical protein